MWSFLSDWYRMEAACGLVQHHPKQAMAMAENNLLPMFSREIVVPSKGGVPRHVFVYACASYASYYREFIRGAAPCHSYEILRDTHSCAIYVDVDHKLELGDDAGDVLRREARFIELLTRFLAEEMPRRVVDEYTILDASSPTLFDVTTAGRKFSRHYILHLRDCVCVNSQAVGVLMEAFAAWAEQRHGARVYFDDAVYTPNRAMRMLGCTKRDAPERPLRRVRTPGTHDLVTTPTFSEELWCRTLVQIRHGAPGIDLVWKPCAPLRPMPSRHKPSAPPRSRGDNVAVRQCHFESARAPIRELCDLLTTHGGYAAALTNLYVMVAHNRDQLVLKTEACFCLVHACAHHRPDPIYFVVNLEEATVRARCLSAKACVRDNGFVCALLPPGLVSALKKCVVV